MNCVADFSIYCMKNNKGHKSYYETVNGVMKLKGGWSWN